MLIMTNLIQLYGRKVVTDLALRSGLANAKSYSPNQGLAPLVDKLWSEPTFASKEALFEKQVDFDADVIQPHLDVYDTDEEAEYAKETRYDPAVDKLDFNKYYRRLEDIADEYIETYVGNLVYTICRLSGGVKSFNYSHAIAPTLRDLEDGSAIELADLELDYSKNEWSDSEVKKALSQLPYVLRRFLNLSCYTGIHVLSFVCSYLIAKEKNRLARQSGSVKTLKKNAVISENVWACDSIGNATKKIEVSNKNLKAYELFDWMEGTLNKYPAYQDDVTNFIHYVKVLNLDITEDMSKYGSDFIRGLTVVTLTPNSQYNQNVFNALAQGTPVYTPVTDKVTSTITRFNELVISNDVISKVAEGFDYNQRVRNFELAKSLHYGYMMALGKIGEKFNYEFYEGFLHCNGELAIIGCGMISNTAFSDGRVLISELGYCVAVSDSLVLDLMTLSNAKDNMLIKVTRNTEESLEGWWSVSL